MFFPFLRKHGCFLSTQDRVYLRQLRRILLINPTNIIYYKTAFTHSTSVSKHHAVDNQRLEFLGDAVLATVVSHYLYSLFPAQNEGFLSQIRSKYVCRSTLHRIAEQMGLDEFIISQEKSFKNNSILGNALEALMGAIYLDKGYKFTQHYIIENVIRKCEVLEIYEDNNYKSRVIAYFQKNKISYWFNTIEKINEDHVTIYHCFLMVNGECLGYGMGTSKKKSEQIASEEVISKIQKR